MDLNKVYKIVILVLVLLLAVGLWINIKNSKNKKSDNMSALDAIATRTSVRAYDKRSVSKDTIDMILRAGMAAPTAINKQPWKFVVVNDKNLLKVLSDSLPHSKMTAKAAFVIIACGDSTKMIEGDGSAFWIQDVSAATENMLLAAHALGLGAVWTGVFPDTKRVAAVQRVLNMPSNIVPLCVIPMGYPAEAPTPKDKWKPENVQYNAF